MRASTAGNILEWCWKAKSVQFILQFIPWRPPAPFIRRGAGGGAV